MQEGGGAVCERSQTWKCALRRFLGERSRRAASTPANQLTSRAAFQKQPETFTLHQPKHPSSSISGPQTRRQWLLSGAAWGLVALPSVSSAIAPSRGATLDRWPTHSPVPGGIARLSLGASELRPRATVLDDGQEVPLLVVGDAGEWMALVGIALATSPGPASISVHRSTGRQTVDFKVLPKQYLVQKVKVAPGMVDLSNDDKARTDRERTHLIAVMATFSEHLPGTAATAPLRMRAPVNGRRSSSFGLRRVFNGQPRSPHSGMDIAAPLGTPVLAPLPGRVIDTGNYFYSGKAVWLDHGGGLISLMGHLSAINAKVGDVLQTGDRLGAVGATGRATGPHLHWGVLLNQCMVDPALLLA